MAKPRGTDGSLLLSLPWTLAALAVSLAPHVQFLPFWITGAFFICAAWRYIIEKRRRPLPSTWFRAALALVCFLGVLATYSSVSGVGPGSALLAIMASLKLLETRKRRDQFVLLFISIFLVMSSLLREQYLWSLPYLIVALLLIMTAWLRMSASAQETARQSFRTGSRLVLYAAPLAIAIARAALLYARRLMSMSARQENGNHFVGNGLTVRTLSVRATPTGTARCGGTRARDGTGVQPHW